MTTLPQANLETRASPPVGGIGVPMPRVEDRRLMSGGGQYVADMAAPGMLHAAFVRSPHAHARLVSIRKPAGHEDMVFTAADLSGLERILSTATLPGFKASEWPVLVADRARHVGEPVAMALAGSQAEAEDLAALVEVEWAPLPAIVTHEDALAADAIRLHEHWADNILVDGKIDYGDVEAARRDAKVTVRRAFKMNRQHPLTLETRGTFVDFDKRLDQLVIYLAHQLPVPMQIGLSRILGVPHRRLRVVVPDVGGSFGLKTYLESETVCVAWAALKLRRAVRWIQDRQESQVCDANCREHWCQVVGYADGQGRILGLEVEAIVNAGAYSPWPWPAGLEAMLAIGNMTGPYDIRSIRGKAINVVSNKPAGQPFRGVARPISCCAHEMVMDAVAQELGLEPVEVRLRNMVRPEQMPYTTVTKKLLDSGDYPRALRRVAELVDLPEVRRRQQAGPLPDGRYLGVGVASFYEQTAYGTGPFGYSAWGIDLVPGLEPAVARLTGDGELIIEVGSHSHGQGHETVFAQVAASALGIDPRRVSVRFGDTDTSPVGTGAYASRSAASVGGAVDAACRELGKAIAKIGGHLLQCEPDKVEIRDEHVHSPGGSVSFREIGKAWYHHPENLPEGMEATGLTATAGYKSHDPGLFAYSSHAVVVAVDPGTGIVEILDYAVVADCGTQLNPLLVKGQILGGLSNGIGNALYEESAYDGQGQPLSVTLADYKAPSAPCMPEVKLEFLTTPSPFGPQGIKGVGENGAIGGPSAISSAVNDALRPLGASLYETPITPARVLAALEAAQGERR